MDYRCLWVKKMPDQCNIFLCVMIYPLVFTTNLFCSLNFSSILFVMCIIEFKLTLFRNCLTCRMLQRVILRDMQLHLVKKQ